ncbi:hypothetical protein AAFF_G00106550 [Aldrovandia affinis]|uniref:Uncharacterized protein n=1 Tax=Aldrovandia affinis TaxID=143900 RepID=A0AAD7T309_9TELE|nr:hypothetical protein AAFF_G00106550 [Aldrovandia affinis]
MLLEEIPGRHNEMCKLVFPSQYRASAGGRLHSPSDTFSGGNNYRSCRAVATLCWLALRLRLGDPCTPAWARACDVPAGFIHLELTACKFIAAGASEALCRLQRRGRGHGEEGENRPRFRKRHEAAAVDNAAEAPSQGGRTATKQRGRGAMTFTAVHLRMFF